MGIRGSLPDTWKFLAIAGGVLALGAVLSRYIVDKLGERALHDRYFVIDPTNLLAFLAGGFLIASAACFVSRRL
jgi:hypothetical protein